MIGGPDIHPNTYSPLTQTPTKSYLKKLSRLPTRNYRSQLTNQSESANADLFAERFAKVTFRDFSGPTGMYINTADMKGK